MVAETGVPPETLSEPQLMGFMADPAMKPDVLFLLRHLALLENLWFWGNYKKVMKNHRKLLKNPRKSHSRLDDESVIGKIIITKLVQLWDDEGFCKGWEETENCLTDGA